MATQVGRVNWYADVMPDAFVDVLIAAWADIHF